MAILTSDHLFAQADGLLTLFPKRRPRQTELRRAVSAAYYGLYHFILKQAADTFVGAKYGVQLPPSPSYVLAYRSITHSWLRDLCSDVAKPHPPNRLKPYIQAPGFAPQLRGFAKLVADLQDRRHTADYDLSARLNRAEAIAAITSAREAVSLFQSLKAGERQMFLALLLFPPRRS